MKQRKLYKARILIMRTASDIFTPIALMLGIYVILHGTVSPGGGFQGGVIVSSAVMMLYLGYGYAGMRKATKAEAMRIGEAVGATVYAGLGFVGADYARRRLRRPRYVGKH